MKVIFSLLSTLIYAHGGTGQSTGQIRVARPSNDRGHQGADAIYSGLIETLHNCNHKYLADKKRCDRMFYRGGASSGGARKSCIPRVKDCYNKAEKRKWDCNDGNLKALTGTAAAESAALAEKAATTDLLGLPEFVALSSVVNE